VAPSRTGAVAVARTSFLLIGWAGILVPSLVREIEAGFRVDDAALGAWYLLNAATYASASLIGGLLTERLGRRVVLTAAAASLAVGLGVIGSAGSWAVFLVGAVPLGLGGGAIDGGMNSLVLSVVDDGRGRALNLLHLCFALGALSAPAIVGLLLDRGVMSSSIFLATAVAAALLIAGPALASFPSGRRTASSGEADPSAEIPPGPSRTPLILLALAIGAYVAAEVGVSSWIVRFLGTAPVAEATLALSGFWGGLALGRLAAARVSDRFSPLTFAAVAAFLAGAFVVLAVLAPSTELSALGFALAGFASGPVFPMIIASGGELFPRRLAATTGTLTAAAVVGGIVYPPLIGFASSSVGIGTGLLGAAALSVLCGLGIVMAARVRAGARSD
jgi:fucose permease